MTWVMWIKHHGLDLRKHCGPEGAGSTVDRFIHTLVGTTHKLWIKLWNAEPCRRTDLDRGPDV